MSQQNDLQAAVDDEQLIDRLADHDDDLHPPAGSTIRQLKAELETLADEVRQPAPSDEFHEESAFKRGVEFVKAIGQDLSIDAGRDKAGPGGEQPELGQVREYKLLAKLGQGGMGTVYKALHTKLDKVVALKVLPADRLQNPDAVSRFEREMKAVGKLNHVNIVAAHDAGETDDMHYLVMELVDGIDLSVLIRQAGPLDVPDACELIRQAADGLQHAHKKGMVHRDIKPSNLMLARTEDSGPVVKMLDMGLALLGDQHASAQRDLTTTGQMMGTLDYMAPEQGTDTHSVDIRADIYALGASLFKLLVGQPPFPPAKYDTPLKLMMSKVTEDAPSIAVLRDDLPAELVAIIDRMLARDPVKRFATPDEVAQALTPFASGANLTALLDSVAGTPPELDVDQLAQQTQTHLTADSHETASEFGEGLPTSPKPLTEGLQETGAEQESGRPAVKQVARSGDLATARGDLATARATAPQSWWTNRRNQIVAVAAGLAGIILLGVVTFLFPTKDGTIVVKIDDPESLIQVTVEGENLVITDKNDGEPITLKPGDHMLRVKRGGLEFDTKNFALRKGEKVVLSVKFVEGEVRVVQKDQTGAKVADLGHRKLKPDPADQSPPQIVERPGPRPTDAEVLKRLAQINKPGEPVRLPGYATNPTNLPGIPREWQVQSKFAHATNAYPSVSPKGTYIAISHDSTYDPYTRILERKSGRLVGVFYDASIYYRRISWSPDEKSFVICRGGWQSSSVYVCALDGLVRAQWTVSKGGEVAWSPDGTRILFSKSNAIEQRTPDGELVATFTPPGHGGSCVWSPDGSRFAVVTEGTVVVYSADGGKPIATLKEDDLSVHFCVWHPSGEKLLTNGTPSPGEQGAARLWTLSGDYIQFGFRRLHERFEAFSPDGRFLLTSYGQIRDLSDKVISNLPLVRQIATSDKAGSDGRFVARWVENDRICLVSSALPGYSIECSPTGRKLAEYDHPMPVKQHSMSWMRDPNRLVSIGQSRYNTRKPWQFKWGTASDLDESSELEGDPAGVVAFSPSGERYAAVHEHGTALVYDSAGKLQYG